MASDPSSPSPPHPSSPSPRSGAGRRDFLRAAGAGAELLVLGGCRSADAAAVPGLEHRYGPGNARLTSGDESRGVRSSYGDRETGEMWMLWPREGMRRWKAFDDEWGRELWLNLYHIEGPRRFVAHRVPLLKDAPLLRTHACHYEISSSGNFVVDRHPRMSNVWIAGGSNAEGFKFGPVVGEYVAQRVLGTEGAVEVAEGVRIPEREFDAVPPPAAAADTARRGAAGGPGAGRPAGVRAR